MSSFNAENQIARRGESPKSPERLHQNDIRFVYFDAGNVLYYFKDVIQATANLMGGPYDLFEVLWKKHDDAVCRGEITPLQLWNECIRLTRYKGPDIDFTEFWSDHLVPIPETHELVKKIAKDRAVGLLTNTYPGTLAMAFRKEKIPNIPYASIISSCDVGLIKPEPDIFRLAYERAGVKPTEILFVDDIPQNIETATGEFNWNGIVFDPQNPAKSVEEISKRLGI